MSRNRQLWILLQTALQAAGATAGRRRRPGSARPVRRVFENRRDACRTRVSRANARARSAFRRARNRTPRCRSACRPACPRACSGTHVGGRAQDDAVLRGRRHAVARLRQVSGMCVVELRQSEVEDFRPASPVRQHDVARLEIAVHHAFLMRRVERRDNTVGRWPARRSRSAHARSGCRQRSRPRPVRGARARTLVPSSTSVDGRNVGGD